MRREGYLSLELALPPTTSAALQVSATFTNTNEDVTIVQTFLQATQVIQKAIGENPSEACISVCALGIVTPLEMKRLCFCQACRAGIYACSWDF